ncbi:cytochrome P450 [Mycolicibacterium insubricum]|jgi:cholest-4-en-3-one 26-monooxygenase|uniref:Steroid C26-monooxygenase n=1 Tax=Mycolicibacterium insubricum TaxID=444597 RepID=A0A1X0DHH1_9MYCO|nr:cytochrome P450 [Mycolicibacterium insubricum]MCB9440611.1 cytochrome P450 [Mycolicibacterium sp.]MCV7080924.1 cytochrome P450 [Mycolicibacterium insubricum]ORA71821.1 steroid C27-monooxygenase [Mycolicibacterium insubricum]BBZ65549.1 cytochrome P450 [Mycolicibacterium insubricum]
MTSTARCPFRPRPDGIDFVDPDVLAEGIPLREFAELRKNAPVWWNAQEPGTGGFTDGGFWVVSRHADIKAISRDPDTFSANRKGVVISFFEGMDEEKIELTKALLINHDPPEHTRLRRIVSRLFAPRAVAELEEKLRTAARRIVEEAAATGSGDFVADIASRLPLLAIADLIGVPAEDHEKVFHWANSVVNLEDPDAGLDDPAVANAQLLAYAYGMADERRRCPADDIVTKLVHADLDGEWMTEEEFGFFVVLLAVAGNETTRNAITHGLNAFLDNPEQWDLYRRERPVTAADEIVRWSTPVYAFQRTATRDVELGGAEISAGQRVGLFYASANFDDDVFENPSEFNVLRNPNPHLGFGGQGTHFCLGANLARTEINLMFNAIADVLPDITKLGEPKRLRSAWLNGVTGFDVRYR